MSNRIAIVGMGCRYPDASSPTELWENVVAGRRAFRRLPPERLRLDDYWSADAAAPDRLYADQAALLEGYEFDRAAFRIAGSTYRSTDLTHWLALDVATSALADAGFAGAEGLPRATTGAVVGNTLTGEFSRASLMRLRWPYVRRVTAATLREQGMPDDQLGLLLEALEERYKQPFPQTNEDSLAGGLSNTIAGRICNYYDLRGGGYTVDGACCASLLSVITACRSLVEGDLDVAVAGGVDLSIDPFELIGFAKTGALARDEMRVYDRRSNGFWPGEGCGMVVLMREEDAHARGCRVHATIAAWGVSSDGHGSITRPEAQGQLLAIDRAYRRAGFDPASVGYFEGHGTGTAVGDETELRVLAHAVEQAGGARPPAALGSVKANIGHTKAAAGIAGLIKAAAAVSEQVLPPATGCLEPHPELQRPGRPLRVLDTPEPWPRGRPVRAGVSAMGFGGINTHLVLERPGGARGRRRGGIDARTRSLAASSQDCELLLLDAADHAQLRERLERLAELAPKLSRAELGDLAVACERGLSGGRVRAAVLARTPLQAAQRLAALAERVAVGAERLVDPAAGVFCGSAAGDPPAIVFLFPGQGSGRGRTSTPLRRRFEAVDRLYRRAGQPAAGGDDAATATAQPRIVADSLAGLRALSLLGIEGSAAVGHSLGELTALHWAGALGEAALRRTAAARGRLMTELALGDGGTMASVAADPHTVERLLPGTDAVIAGLNSPRQTTVSGTRDAIAQVGERAEREGLAWTRLPVSHAFHSPLLAPAAAALAEHLAGERVGRPRRAVVSTVTGNRLTSREDLRELLRDQVTAPVRFADALAKAAAGAGLLVEVGPGHVLSGLAASQVDVPAIALETDGSSLAGLLSAAGAAFALGAPVRHEALSYGRLTRPLPLDRPLRFLANPCEQAPEVDAPAARQARPDAEAAGAEAAGAGPGTLELLRRMVAQRAELPADSIGDDTHLLDDLHLSSITVGQLAARAAQELGMAPPQTPSSFATATLRDVAEALDSIAATSPGQGQASDRVDGVATWVRPFVTELVAGEPPVRAAPAATGKWKVFAPDQHPLAAPLQRALEAECGDGVLLCLPPDSDERHLGPLLAAARAALEAEPPGRFVLVQHHRGASAAALAKTLHLEAPRIHTTVVDVPTRPEAVDWVVAEVAGTDGFSQASYQPDGSRAMPRLRAMPPAARAPAPLPLGADDVLLVTGGGKGISAECALALARASGARLALLGRSDPAEDAELSANLERFRAAGISHSYLRADVTDAAAVRAAVARAQEELGPVTAVLHGAGRNQPRPLAQLDEDELRRTLAPKLDGLRAVLEATDPDRLRLLVTFASIIGRGGLQGEAHYALANEWLTQLTQRVAEERPGCRCLALEWSVWSGAGMGERLDVVEGLLRGGVTPISPDEGAAILQRLLSDVSVPEVVVVSGRTDALPTLATSRRDLPLLRFLEQPRVHHPDVELVTDAELSNATDPYLDDHLLDGERLFPAVLGVEAMAQAAAALLGRDDAPALEEVRFERPIVVPLDGTVTLRVAALARGPGEVEVAVRSSETGFQSDHFHATCRFGSAPRGGQAAAGGGRPGGRQRPRPDPPATAVPLDPAAELYGELLFQGPRFQRLRGYRRVAATSCDATVERGAPAAPWFGSFLPGRLLLGDPGARDAVMHAIQCCVPDAILLPAAVERLLPGTSETPGELRVLAEERLHDGDTYVYDVTVLDGDGETVESWQGLRLRAVRHRGGGGPWPPALLGPYLERRLPDLLDGAAPRLVLERGENGSDARPERGERLARAAERLFGPGVRVRHRPDGKPEVDTAETLSVAHSAGVTLAVAWRGTIGCDLEVAEPRDRESWRGMLGAAGQELAGRIAEEAGEDEAVAATRVWSAVECLRKVGRPADEPLTLASPPGDGGVVLHAGGMPAATFTTALDGVPAPVVVAILAYGRDR